MVSRSIFTQTTSATGDDVMRMTLDDTRAISPLVRSPFAERNGIVSRDGRWLAYEANDSGRFEIYVRPFPKVDGGRWQVSTDGGTQTAVEPRWPGVVLRRPVRRDHARRCFGRLSVGGNDSDAGSERGLLHPAGQSRSHLRHLVGWSTPSDDQGLGRSQRLPLIAASSSSSTGPKS